MNYTAAHRKAADQRGPELSQKKAEYVAMYRGDHDKFFDEAATYCVRTGVHPTDFVYIALRTSNTTIERELVARVKINMDMDKEWFRAHLPYPNEFIERAATFCDENGIKPSYLLRALGDGAFKFLDRVEARISEDRLRREADGRELWSYIKYGPERMYLGVAHGQKYFVTVPSRFDPR